ncbi:MAG: futalosine hydrolase, partial [Planctomycetota bacterium]
PTQGEMRVITELFSGIDELSIQRIGLGPTVPAARTAALLTRYRPRRVMLVGIAGTFDREVADVGSACRFDEVAVDGIGVGRGNEFQSTSDLGWSQFEDEFSNMQIGDRLPLIATYNPQVPSLGTLLTVASASASPTDASWRRKRYPDAIAEDMEGFAVASACALAGVDLQIVRGISNIVGERDHAHWRVEEALRAAAELAISILSHQWIPTVS